MMAAPETARVAPGVEVPIPKFPWSKRPASVRIPLWLVKKRRDDVAALKFLPSNPIMDAVVVPKPLTS